MTAGRPDNVVVLTKGATNEGASWLARDVYHTVRAFPGIARDAQGAPLVSPELVVQPFLATKSGREENVLVRGVTPEVRAMADSGSGSGIGSGGMTSKLQAAEIAERAGIAMAIVSGKAEAPLASALVKQGFAVIVPERPGHGATAGPYLEDQGGCADADYTKSAHATAGSIVAALAFMRKGHIGGGRSRCATPLRWDRSLSARHGLRYSPPWMSRTDSPVFFAGFSGTSATSLNSASHVLASGACLLNTPGRDPQPTYLARIACSSRVT
jgi:hypothetical protein